ncbi:MAG: DinB family protein [Chitinophagaceae bacterium]
MTAHLPNEVISNQILLGTQQLISYCESLDDSSFFYQPGEKWSAAQQVKHLTTAANISKLAFLLPKFVVSLAGGKPNRPSRTYDELVAKYKLKLEQGGKASKRYTPKTINASYGKQKLLNAFNRSMLPIAKAIRKNWSEQQLDKYIVPHPLLGKITIRELGYFTIHHIQHHLDSIKKCLNHDL